MFYLPVMSKDDLNDLKINVYKIFTGSDVLEFCSPPVSLFSRVIFYRFQETMWLQITSVSRIFVHAYLIIILWQNLNTPARDIQCSVLICLQTD